MPKQQTKEMTKKSEEKEEHKDEQITDDDVDNETSNETSSEDDEETNTEEKKKQKKLTTHELYNEISNRFSILIKADEAFIEKEKEFEKDQKEFNSSRKKIMREIDSFMKRFEKAFTSEVGKKKKPRKTENAGKGGFNKQADVPELLRNYIGLDEDDKKSRPEVARLLNEKFKETGLMTTKKNEHDKEIKIIKLDKATAKKLKRKEGDEFRSKDLQTFIAQFYREANNISA
jgi:hypothetical protein